MPPAPLALSRRALAALAGATLARPTLAQASFPDHPVKLIVPWSPGGSADGQFRVLADQAGRRLGQPVIVENRAGATGTLGAIAVKDARPDGYLLTQMHQSSIRAPLLQLHPRYDPRTDFSWIIQLTGSLLGIVVRADAPWADLPALLDYAKANPGKVTYGTLGIGSTQHLAMEQVGLLRGIEWTHVPYRGTADTLTALMAGQIDVASDSSAWAAMVEDGRFRLLCTFGSARAKRFPNTPTLHELGVNYVSDAAYGICGPRGMDAAVVRTLHDAFKGALYDPAHLAALDRFDQPVLYLDSADWAAAGLRYYEAERAVIQRIGLRPS